MRAGKGIVTQMLMIIEQMLTGQEMVYFQLDRIGSMMFSVKGSLRSLMTF
jgi:hypothetical protein